MWSRMDITYSMHCTLHAISIREHDLGVVWLIKSQAIQSERLARLKILGATAKNERYTKRRR